MLYLDTSVLVALFAAEASTQRAQAWVADQDGGLIGVSLWVETEFTAALAAKIRLGAMDSATRDAAEMRFRALCRESLTQIEILPSHFANASRLARDVAASLRGGDALHLAIAEMSGATLCTLDRRQAQAGQALGISMLLI